MLVACGFSSLVAITWRNLVYAGRSVQMHLTEVNAQENRSVRLYCSVQCKLTVLVCATKLLDRRLADNRLDDMCWHTLPC